MTKKIITVLLLILGFVFLVLGIPVIINELYKMNAGYLTLWGAPDVLSFYGAILSGLIAVGSLIATIYFTKKDTEKQLKFSTAQNNAPFFVMRKVLDTPKYLENIENKKWSKDYVLTNSTDSSCVDLILTNVGSGIALDISLDNLKSVECSSAIIQYACQNDNIKITIDIKEILSSDFWKDDKLEYKETFALKYKNTMGINLKQNISIFATINNGQNTLNVTFENISSQNISFINNA